VPRSQVNLALHLLARMDPPWLAGLGVSHLGLADCGSTVSSNQYPVN